MNVLFGWHCGRQEVYGTTLCCVADGQITDLVEDALHGNPASSIARERRDYVISVSV